MATTPRNQILQSLDADALDHLLAHAQRETLPFGTVLFCAGDLVDQVYFPETGLISVIAGSGQGEQTEAGLVGREGAVGLVEACGSGVMAAECTVQVESVVWRVRAADCRQTIQAHPAFLSATLRDLEFQLVETRQAALCRAYHPIVARLARWLLELGDRDPLPSPELTMTHQYLAAMLAVQRTTVSMTARVLQDRGLINYRRGRIEICDHDALSAVACECRATLQAERRRICEIDDADIDPSMKRSALGSIAERSRPHSILMDRG